MREQCNQNVEGEGEVLNSVFPSAAVVGSAASSLSGVILTEGLMASSSDKDEDRRSVRGHGGQPGSSHDEISYP